MSIFIYHNYAEFVVLFCCFFCCCCCLFFLSFLSLLHDRIYENPTLLCSDVQKIIGIRSKVLLSELWCIHTQKKMCDQQERFELQTSCCMICMCVCVWVIWYGIKTKTSRQWSNQSIWGVLLRYCPYERWWWVTLKVLFVRITHVTDAQHKWRIPMFI